MMLQRIIPQKVSKVLWELTSKCTVLVVNLSCRCSQSELSPLRPPLRSTSCHVLSMTDHYVININVIQLITDLSFWITEPTVKLQEFWSITSQYQSCIQYSYSKVQQALQYITRSNTLQSADNLPSSVASTTILQWKQRSLEHGILFSDELLRYIHEIHDNTNTSFDSATTISHEKKNTIAVWMTINTMSPRMHRINASWAKTWSESHHFQLPWQRRVEVEHC